MATTMACNETPGVQPQKAARSAAPLSTTSDPRPDPGFGLYVHWPFCRAKCPYCDFNSHVRPAVDHDRWREALLAELAHYAERAGRRRLTSIFFGGGTPSLMAPDTVAAIVQAAHAHFDVVPDAEITLEANPTSAEAERFASFRAAGVNRISLGVQALDDEVLRFLGRQHSVAEALAAVALARRHVPRVSFDLITARPGQTPEAWRAELQRALAEGPEHLSVYQLTIEPQTPFHAAWRRGELAALDEDTAAAVYDTTQEVMDAAGLPAYEVSNHARPGAASRHNLTYWRYGDYVGIGPGAHGRLTDPGGVKRATRQHRAPEIWLQTVARQGHATQESVPLDRKTRREELLMMGLRLDEGIARGAVRRELGAELAEILDRDALQDLLDVDLVTLDGDALRATPAGRLRLNAVLAHLLRTAPALT